MNEIERIKKIIRDVESYETVRKNRFHTICKEYLLNRLNNALVEAYIDSDFIKNDDFLKHAVGIYQVNLLDHDLVPVFDYYYEDFLKDGYDAYVDCELVVNGERPFISFIEKYEPYIAKLMLEKYNFHFA